MTRRFRSQIRRIWYKPWIVEYSWVHSAYGAVVGYAPSREAAETRLQRAIYELIHDDQVPSGRPRMGWSSNG